jgi:bifunctional lysine-specific demethylase and histidyl-hydroxylase NO66
MSDTELGRPGAHASGRPALRRCVAGDPEAFAAQAWGRHAVLSRADDLAKGFGGDAPSRPGFDDLFSLEAVDELLSRRGLRTPFIRVAKQGQVVDSSHFTGGAGVGAEVGDQVRDDRLATLFADGHTVVLQGVHRTWGPVTDLATGLGTDLGHPVQVNAYVTPPSSQGFSAHYDVHDVFVLQIAGSKRWHVHAPVHADPLRGQPWNDHADAVRARAQEEPLLDEVLHPGDALYLPRGFLHSATALGGVSAHLTVGVHVVTRYALLEALVESLADDPELRRTLPLGIDVADPEQLAPHLDEVAARMAAQLRAAADEPERVAGRVRRRVWSGNRPEPLRPLAHAAALGSLDERTAVRSRAGLKWRLVTGDPVRLELPGRALDLAAGEDDAVRLLLTGDVVRVGELPGAPVELVRRLLRDGVLVTPDPAGGAQAPAAGNK